MARTNLEVLEHLGRELRELKLDWADCFTWTLLPRERALLITLIEIVTTDNLGTLDAADALISDIEHGEAA